MRQQPRSTTSSTPSSTPSSAPSDSLARTVTDLALLEKKISDLGMTKSAVARRAGMPPSALSSAIHGREYLGAARRARLQQALHEIAMEQAAQRAAEQAAQEEERRDVNDAPAPQRPAPTPKIRRL